MKNGKSYYSRANYLVFQRASQKCDSNLDNYKESKFIFEVAAFSYIDIPIIFDIDIGRNKYQPNQEGMIIDNLI